ncbi:MAG: Ribosomal protein S12 methylthiotransferase accessory factor YcaO [Candidatus Methanohalarchaeum thermophilum]|uniref:Ribosomal protein S12 methylthiotransferase accessory factor YcaO n=1 Tax=Methanohalarchaeum thermophilum TaxID=1903181 RepID=A0A1Q6DW13_METT1|nr:MAG: Ribosomal protein S12 methylthiotransferase accessory factor YcaO [Candidatus Methanohalarchaeum thermophilum]
MRLRSRIKEYKNGSHRVKSPSETLKDIQDNSSNINLSKIEDITELDRVGLPVVTASRPSADEGAISLYKGKGLNKTEAKVSAIMESIERYSAELHDRDLVKASFNELKEDNVVLNPRKLILPDHIGNFENIRLPWVKSYDLIEGEEIYVPAEAVFHPLSIEYTGGLFKTNTNGLASGNVLEEAVLHALTEVVERDAWSIAKVKKETGPVIEPESNKLNELINKFKENDVSIILRDLTHDLNVPTFAAVSEDLRKKDPSLLTIGFGSHPNSEVALKRAITEVAQSRLLQIYNSKKKENSVNGKIKKDYKSLKKRNKFWFNKSKSNVCSFSEIRNRSFGYDDILDDIEEISRNLMKIGVDRIIIHDLTREEIGIPVVKVIVPGMEAYSVDEERMGLRCKYAKKGTYSYFKD